MTEAQPTVRENADEKRYEIFVDGELKGFADYIRTEQLITYTHTEVFPGNEGQGLAGILVRHALDGARAAGLPVLPICPFVDRWMSRHEDYRDLDYRRR